MLVSWGRVGGRCFLWVDLYCCWCFSLSFCLLFNFLCKFLPPVNLSSISSDSIVKHGPWDTFSDRNHCFELSSIDGCIASTLSVYTRCLFREIGVTVFV